MSRYSRPATLIAALTFAVSLLLPGIAAAATAEEIDIDVTATLQKFQQAVPEGAPYLQAAKGVLVFPRVFRAGVGVGGEYGEGALRINGRTVEYWSTATASIGFQLGAQTKSIVMVFLTDDALMQFRNSENWRAGVDGSVAVVEWGTAANVDTINTKDPIVAFIFGTKGLMANVSLEGSKFILLDK